jgi:hypothetical protein
MVPRISQKIIVHIGKKAEETGAYREYAPAGESVLRTETRVEPGKISLSFRTIYPASPLDVVDMQVLGTSIARYARLGGLYS